jgi:type VI secretion system secreted protein Hcp
MAVNAYLMIEGTPGPSTSKKDAIDILSFSWGASQTSTYQAGSSGHEARSGRANLSEVTVMKVLDKTSPELFDHCVTGNVLPKVTLFYDKATGSQQEDYFSLELTDAIITNIQLSGSNEHPVESLSFAYQKIKMGYNPEGDDGSLTGFVYKGFDIATLKPF